MAFLPLKVGTDRMLGHPMFVATPITSDASQHPCESITSKRTTIMYMYQGSEGLVTIKWSFVCATAAYTA